MAPGRNCPHLGQNDYDLDHLVPHLPCEMLCRICIVQIQARKHVLDRGGYTGTIRQPDHSRSGNIYQPWKIEIMTRESIICLSDVLNYPNVHAANAVIERKRMSSGRDSYDLRRLLAYVPSRLPAALASCTPMKTLLFLSCDCTTRIAFP